jgi:FixJ family two-component response regulator
MASMTAIVVGVDDDRRVLESLDSLMATAGYVVLLFSSAEDFLQSGRLVAASCVIADVRMPGMDGIEMQRRIRVERPELPIIFISAHCDDDVRRQALDGGAIEFLHKPFDPVHLLTTIGHALKPALNNDAH